MTRRQAFDFGPSLSDRRRQERQRRSIERAERRRRQADLKRAKREAIRQRRERRRLEAKWRKDTLRRRRADDKKLKRERKRWERQQKKQALGGGMGGGRGSAAGLRTARNLLTLANQIGVLFSKDDQAALIAFADQELAGSGDDVYTLYERMTHLTFIGRRVLSVVEQYAPEDVASGEPNSAETVGVNRVAAAAEIIGDWQRTSNVQNATVLGLAITQTLGATPEAIAADQRALERELTDEQYQATLEKYAGKSRIWQTVHYWLHPEDRPENARDVALAELDQNMRESDASEARAQEALASTGESVTVQDDSLIARLRSALGI